MRAPIDWQKYRKKEILRAWKNHYFPKTWGSLGVWKGGGGAVARHSAWLRTLTLSCAMAQVLQCQEKTYHYILSLIDVFIDRLSIHTWHKRKYK